MIEGEWNFLPRTIIVSSGEYKYGTLSSPNKAFKMEFYEGSIEEFKQLEHDKSKQYEIKIREKKREDPWNTPRPEFHYAYWFCVDDTKPNEIRICNIHPDSNFCGAVTISVPSAGFDRAFCQAKKYFECGVIENPYEEYID